MSVLRSADEIESMRRAGSILASTLKKLKAYVRPGVKTEELDELARKEILRQGAYPAFKNYKGFPANICTSVNEVVVHGIPSSRKLREGDIIAIDIGVKLREYYADGAITVGVGQISKTAENLIRVTEEALAIGISNAHSGNRLFDISASIQRHVESSGFSIVRVFVGHGIGTKIHEDPEIPNFGSFGTGPRLLPGMVLAIEPMVNAGVPDIEILKDGWTAVTKDGKLSAHFEHTVAVRDNGAEILTA